MSCKSLPFFLILFLTFAHPQKVSAYNHSDISAFYQSYTNRLEYTDRLVDYNLYDFFNERWLAPVVGASKGYGEMAGFIFVYDGISVYAGLGKDWILKGRNNEKLLWHTGLGYTITSIKSWRSDMTPEWSMTLGVTFSENSHYEHHALTLDYRYYRWVDNDGEWGIFGGGGIGVADITKSNRHMRFAWNVEIGVAFRISFGLKDIYDVMNKIEHINSK